MEHPDFPSELTKKLPLTDVLATLNFVTYEIGQKWKINDVDFSITQAFWNCWFLVRGPQMTSRTYTPEREVLLESPISHIELMAKLYELWVQVSKNQQPSDPNLLLGKKWLRYQEDIKKLAPQPPTVWADREFFRYCLTYIERHHDWVEKDYEIIFKHVSGQIIIIANNTAVYCPAKGYWIGEVAMSAKALFRHLPKRFIGDVVSLQSKGNRLLLDRRSFPARWVDSTEN